MKSFSERISFEERRASYEQQHKRHPDKVFVVADRHNKSQMAACESIKFVCDPTQKLHVIRRIIAKRVLPKGNADLKSVEPQMAIYIYCGNRMLNGGNQAPTQNKLCRKYGRNIKAKTDTSTLNLVKWKLSGDPTFITILMISQAIRYFKNSRHSLRMAFTTDSHKLNSILAKMQVQSDGKELGLLESGVVASQHMDPTSKKMIITLNLTKDYRQIKSLIRTHLEAQGITDVDIALAAKPKQEKYQRKGNLLGIKRIIAVSSCKGGVGKSTIAVNLAASLSRQGKRVGIFDSDIYGPSLPTLIGKEGITLEARQQNPKEIVPVQYEGIKCMSFGFVAKKPAVMRGPMVSSVLSQLLHQTYWGELDYLVVDMPPGTGDIQISLCQQLKFDGAVIVTTPQRLAFMDVIKGIEMFQDLRVKILSVVENMAYHSCEKCGHQDRVFGRGYTQMIMEQFGILNTVRFPILSEISRLSDNGTPIALVLPESHALCKTYEELSTKIQIDLQQPLERTFVYYNTATRRIIIEEKDRKKQIDPYVLRGLCRCAGCVDELSGALLLKKETIDVQVYPVRVEEKGNYAVAMVWSDGHRSSIYPYKRLLSQDIPESQV